MQINDHPIEPNDRHLTKAAFDAVCNELGITAAEVHRRKDVAQRIEAAWRGGRKQPLNLVAAGLGEFYG